MIPYFHAVWGVRRSDETHRLTNNARAVLNVLRHEWEMSSLDLRTESGVKDRRAFTAAMDELQAAMIVVPSEIVYRPFTYIWTLAVGRFPDGLRRRVSRETAFREIARCFLAGAGMTVRAVASDRLVAARRRTRQSRARCRGLRRHARHRRLSADGGRIAARHSRNHAVSVGEDTGICSAQRRE
jgi:hypothetical protein